MQLIGDTPLTAAERQKRYRDRHPDRIRRYAMSDAARVSQRRRNREYEKRNPQRSIQKNAVFRATAKGSSCYLFWNAQRRAKIARIEFTLTKEWIFERVLRGICEVTGIPFVIANGRKPWAPSLDKIDPKGGYTPDNVQVVVWIYNTCKWDSTHKDVVTFARAVVEKNK